MSENNSVNWIDELAHNAKAQIELEAKFTQEPEQTAKEEVIAWLDKLFDYLLEYTYKFNLSVHGTSLELTCQRPVLFNSMAKELHMSYFEQSTWVFKGTVLTHIWSLVLLGTSGGIQAYIVPNDEIIAFSTGEDVFEPYLKIFLTVKNNVPHWTINNMEIHNCLPEIAKDLFTTLIKVTTGERNADEKSQLHKTIDQTNKSNLDFSPN